jgi:phosphate acetyltransferase
MFKDDLMKKASARNKKIVFPEGEDPRIISAAHTLVTRKICQPVLIARKEVFDRVRNELKLPEAEFEIVEPEFNRERDVHEFFEKRRKKDISMEKAAKTVEHTAFKGALMLDRGDVDACVCGAVFTTGETVRAAIQCLGTKPGIQTVSSFFLMVWEDRILLYSDCAVIPEPTANQLVDITLASAESWKKMTDTEPEIALLSFSTYGSAEHASIVPITQALRKIRERQPDLHVDGELQADAALLDTIGRKKAPGSTVAGKANVLIFPNLHAGNISYKLTQRLAGATAVGPILQGLAKPMNDLSRGCNAEDVVLVAAISALQCSK